MVLTGRLVDADVALRERARMTNKLLGTLLVSCALVAPALAQPKTPAAPAAPAAPAKMAMTPAAKLVWTPLDPKQPKGLQTSVVNGDMMKGPTSFFLKIPAGGKSGAHAHTNDYYAVLISGGHGHGASEKEASSPMTVGSTWFQPGKEMHFDTCNGKKECVILIMFPSGGFDFIPGPAAAAPADPKAPPPKK